MKTLLLRCAVALAATASAFAEPALTIYNENFAVVRGTLPIELKAGVNTVSFDDTTAHVEPQSVILRDPAGKVAFTILEQNYRNDPVSQERLLALHEGKTIEFEIVRGEQKQIVPGKIIRSGYVAHSAGAMQRYGLQYQMAQMAMAYGGGNAGVNQPIIEIEGKVRFGLPGTPIFPALADDSILKPALTWQLQSAQPAKLEAELAYITGGMSWQADYNVLAPEKGDALEIIGWVTMDNQSGKTFTNASIKLMAGDVNKVQTEDGRASFAVGAMMMNSSSAGGPPVTEKAFDEYHLYSLARPATLRDRETKQVEFIRAAGIESKRLYVYDGVKIDAQRYRGHNLASVRQQEDYGTEMNTKVWAMQEFKNSVANHLGMPLPKGRLRFYRRDGAQLEFTGENVIDHTPKDETVRVNTGNAFDLVGERRRTNFKADSGRNFVDETFEIKLRNHKTEPVEIRVVEHLYRWTTWDITAKSHTFLKTDAQTVEFRIPLAPDEEKTVTYTVHYSW